MPTLKVMMSISEGPVGVPEDVPQAVELTASRKHPHLIAQLQDHFAVR